MPFQAEIQTLDASSLDALFEQTQDVQKTEDVDTSSSDVEIKTPDAIDNIEQVELEDKEEEDSEEESEEEKEEGSEEKDTTEEGVNEVLKNSVEYLIQKGVWKDFDGREDLEMNEEVYGELTQRQAEHAAYEIVNELIDSTGSYGKAILSHIKAGGNPDEIIDLFKEQKQSQQIDTSSDDGKQRKIESYYKDVLGWKSEKVDKYINRLIEDDTIKSEFEEVEDLYNAHYKSKLEGLQTKQKEQEQQNLRSQQQFVNTINSALQENEDLTDNEKRFVANSILNLKHKLPNGQKVNDFYVKLAEIQSNPKEYIDLVRYVMDSQGYKTKLTQKTETQVKRDTFNFIKGNSTIKKPTTTSIEIDKSVPKRQQKQQGTDFSFALK